MTRQLIVLLTIVHCQSACLVGPTLEWNSSAPSRAILWEVTNWSTTRYVPAAKPDVFSYGRLESVTLNTAKQEVCGFADDHLICLEIFGVRRRSSPVTNPRSGTLAVLGSSAAFIAAASSQPQSRCLILVDLSTDVPKRRLENCALRRTDWLSVSLSDNGQSLAYQVGEVITVQNTSTLEVHYADRGSNPSLSPDGKTIAYWDHQRRLTIVTLATGKMQFLGNGAIAPTQLHWDSSSRCLLVERRDVGGLTLALIDRATLQMNPLATLSRTPGGAVERMWITWDE